MIKRFVLYLTNKNKGIAKFLGNNITRLWNIKEKFKREIGLEIHLSDHCNLNCASCTHFSPIADEKLLSPEILDKELSLLNKFIPKHFFTNIRLMGGEPLLNPDIIPIVYKVRKYFPEESILIVTNGILLNKMDYKFIQACKENNIIISFTRYPININIDPIINDYINNGIKVIKFGDKTQTLPFYERKLRPQKNKKGRKINFYKCMESACWQLSDMKIFSCPQCAYSKYLNKKFNASFKIESQDYLDLNKLSILKLYLFKIKSKPFCEYCQFPQKRIKWGISKKTSAEWIYN